MSALPFIEALQKETGLDITLPPDGAVGLSLGERNMLLQWLEAKQAFVVYIEVGQLVGWRDADICKSLLGSNFLMADSLGGAISYNEANNMVGLNFTLPIYGLENESFLKELNTFILYAEAWSQRLQAMTQEMEEWVEKEQAALQAAFEAGENAQTQSPLHGAGAPTSDTFGNEVSFLRV